MGKDEATEKDTTGKAGKDNDASPDPNKKSRSDADESSESDSSSELEPTRTKKGEPPDNLRRRSEWFQKRHS